MCPNLPQSRVEGRLLPPAPRRGDSDTGSQQGCGNRARGGKALQIRDRQGAGGSDLPANKPLADARASERCGEAPGEPSSPRLAESQHCGEDPPSRAGRPDWRDDADRTRGGDHPCLACARTRDDFRNGGPFSALPVRAGLPTDCQQPARPRGELS